jgi:hypothetical protein
MTRIFLIAILVILSGMTFAAQVAKARDTEGVCRLSPALVSACFVVHGRLSLYNRNPAFRIWRIGTNRMLGVLASDRSDPEGPDMLIPRAVQSLLYKSLSYKDEMATGVYGNCSVCPLTKDFSGAMQMVCIAGAKDLVARKVGPNG